MKNETEDRTLHQTEVYGETFEIEIIRDLPKDKMVERAYELCEFYGRQDLRTIETRFGSLSTPRICDVERILSRICLAVCLKDKDGKMIGQAELARLGNTAEAEIGVVTDINHRRKGIGITLVKELILAAAETTNIKSINGYVCVENLEILNWTHKMMTKGFPVTLKYIMKDGLYWVRIDLDELRMSQELGNF